MMPSKFKAAFSGIWKALRGESSVRIIFIVFAVVVAVCSFLRLTGLEWCVILLCCGVVLFAELINTAIECIVDMITKEYDETAGKVKDIAAGATLVLAVVSVIIGFIIVIPHLIYR